MERVSNYVAGVLLGMWDFLFFMGFSILETSAIYYLIFRIFKIDIMVPEMLFSGLLMAFISYELRVVHQLVQVDLIVQVNLAFLFMWLLFRIHVFYAVILTGLSYLAYFMIQAIWYIIMDSLGLFYRILDFPMELSTYLLQTISATCAFLIGWTIYAKRRGFDYIPDKPRGFVTITGKDKILLALTVVSVISILVITINLGNDKGSTFYVVPIIAIPIVYTYLLVSYRRDRDY